MGDTMTDEERDEVRITQEKHEMALERSPQALPERMITMILDAARDKSIDIDKLERLMAMQQKMVIDQRKIAYTGAMSRLQAKLPQIDRHGHILVKGQLRSKYATIEDIDTAIRPLLAEEGFSFSCDQEDSQDKIRKFSGKMSHEEGHEEVKHVRLPFDASDFRSAVQSEKSTYSYAARILLTMHLNLVTRDEDNDGQGGEFVTKEQVLALRDLLKELKSDEREFLKVLNVEKIEDIGAKDYRRALNLLETKKRAQSTNAKARATEQPAESVSGVRQASGPEPGRVATSEVKGSASASKLTETKPGVYETSGGLPFVDATATANITALQIHQAISRCKTERSLNRLGEDIAKGGYTTEERDDLRQVFVAKLKDLKKTQTSAAPESAGAGSVAKGHDSAQAADPQETII